MGENDHGQGGIGIHRLQTRDQGGIRARRIGVTVSRRRRRWGAAVAVAFTAGGLIMAGTAVDGGPRYLLPWTAGRSFAVLQGPYVTDPIGGCASGCGSHRDEDGHDAWDFDLPEGTPVLAARGGTVRLVVSSWGADHCGGLTPGGNPQPGFFYGENMGNQANLVLIDHGDGTSALYLHLSAVDPTIQSLVKEHGSIHQGQRLGLSGRTGLTGCVPHLHFQVERSVPSDWYTESLAVGFADPNVQSQNLGGVPAEGGLYQSSNSAGS